ncbi:MAG: 2-oxo acid dehydrogenase subunit E2, partial [Clostridiales bacterium]|nr:2-oxo acid dehydrogenase subunit E2 [Clostridiales bacterium]
HTQEFMREMRRSGELPNLSLYQIIYAAMVRTIVDVPEINRFVQNGRIYARNEIKGSMVVMRGLTKESERSTIMPRFQLEDTLYDVVERINNEIKPIDLSQKKVREDTNKSSFDMLQSALSAVPAFFLHLTFDSLKLMDKYGFLPKGLNKLSPFHSSFFITNMGSLGMMPIYHHIYEFGTLSCFGAIGTIDVVYKMDKHGKVHKKSYLNTKFVADERATDGFIYAMAMRDFKKYVMKPELLLVPPKHIVHDNIDR